MDSKTQQYVQREVYSVGRNPTQFIKGLAVIEKDGQFTHVGDIVYPAPKRVLCRTCNEAGHLAANCPTVRCKQCDAVGHKKSDCPEGPRCHNCDQPGHVKANCPTIVCQLCQEMGHKRSDCPRNPRKQRKAKKVDRSQDAHSVSCESCGVPGHTSDNCDTQCTNCGKVGHGVRDCMQGIVNLPVSEFEHQDEHQGKDGEKHEDEDKRDEDERGEDERGEDKRDEDKRDEDEDEGEETKVEVQFRSMVVDEFLTVVGFRIQVSWSPETGPLTREYRDGTVEFTHANIDGTIHYETIEDPEASDKLETMLGPDQIRRVAAELRNPDRGSPALLYISFVFDPDKTPIRHSKFMGARIFVPEPDFGPYTDAACSIRDLLLSTSHDSKTTFHFIAVDGPVELIQNTNASLEQQRSSSPLGDFFRDGQPNYQKGMQRACQERPRFSMPALYTFPTFHHWAIPQYFGQVSELEAHKSSPPEKTVIRLIQFASSRVFLGVLEQTPTMQLREDSTILIDFQGAGIDDSQKWRMTIIESLPFIPATMACGWLHRPREGDQGFVSVPRFGSEHVIDAAQLTALPDTGEALAKHRGIYVWTQEHHPHSGADRLINSLNYLSRNLDKHEVEEKLLCGTTQMQVAEVDYFAQDVQQFGHELVQQAKDLAFQDLSDEQRQATGILSRLKGNVGIFHGCGGVGKSHILIAFMLYEQAIQTLTETPRQGRGAAWVVSPLNKQLDNLGSRASEALLKQYHELIQQGYFPPYPIVVRRHMRGTETSVWKGPSQKRRDAVVGRHRPAYLEEESAKDDEGKTDEGKTGEDDEGKTGEDDEGKTGEDDEGKTGEDDEDDEDDRGSEAESVESVESVDMNANLPTSLATEFVLREAYRKHQLEGSDRRLKVRELSEGQWMLHLAGFEQENGERHPCAAPVERFARFRQKLRSFAAGDDFGKDDLDELTVLSNEVARELAAISNVILMTPDAVCQARNYQWNPPRVVCHDEAGKATELQTVAVMTRAKYAEREDVGDPSTFTVPHLLFGDIFQPAAPGGSNAENPWRAQETLSFFARTLAISGTSVTLRSQHRYTPMIQDLINFILPRAELVQAPGRKQNAVAAKVEKRFQDLWDVEGSLVFITKRMADYTLSSTQSRYNADSAELVTAVIFVKIRTGIRGHWIGWGVPYRAQLRYAQTALHALALFCRGHAQYDQYYEDVLAVEVFTIDGKQGEEKEVVILDMVVTSSLKFMRNTPRMLLALTRPRAGLVIVGDIAGVTAEYTGKKHSALTSSAFGQVYKFCAERRLIIDADEDRLRKQIKNLRSPFKVKKAIETLHSMHPERREEPYSFEDMVSHKLAIPPLDDPDAGQGSASGSEQGSWGGGAGGGGWGGGAGGDGWDGGAGGDGWDGGS